MATCIAHHVLNNDTKNLMNESSKKNISNIKGTPHSLETATGTEEKQREHELEGILVEFMYLSEFLS